MSQKFDNSLGCPLTLAFLFLVLSTGCGNDQKNAQIGASPNTPKESPEKQLPGEPKKPDNPDKNPQTPVKKTYLLVGGRDVLSLDLYLLSSDAHDSVPLRFSSARDTEYLEALPFPGLGSKVLAIGKERSSSKYSLELIQNFSTNRVLFKTDRVLSSPSVSPNGEWIAFTSDSTIQGSGRINLLNINTRTITPVPFPKNSRGEETFRADDKKPVFAPDGKGLIFERKTGESSSFLILSLDTSRAGELGNLKMPEEFVSTKSSDVTVTNFQFSPDRKHFFYLIQTGHSSQIVYGQMSGKEMQQARVLTSAGQSVHEPLFSPDGKKILYWSDTKDGQVIQIYDIEKASANNLTDIVVPNGNNLPQSVVCPTMSPDMTEVYYAANSGSWDGVFKITLSDRSVTALTNPNFPSSYFCPKVLENYEVNP